MKKLQLTLIAFSLFFTTVQAQELPAPSPYSELTQRIGLTDVTLMYSRPGVKERTIFGDLEPYDQVWRTGANAATKIKFSSDVMVGGNEVKEGTYSIVTIPGKESWKLMINTDLSITENSYKAENNVAEISMKPESNDMVETMTFTFANVKDDKADLVFEWEKTQWSVSIEVKVKEQALENIEAKLNEIEKAYGTYNRVARYYLDNDLDLDKALVWSKKSVEIEAKFWNVYTLSLIQKEKGDVKAALETAKKSLAMSEEAKYEPYIKRNKKNIAEWSK